MKLYAEQSPSTKEKKANITWVPYWSAVGSLIFTIVYIRPDIIHVVGTINRCMMNYSSDHWIVVKSILRYLRGASIIHFVIWALRVWSMLAFLIPILLERQEAFYHGICILYNWRCYELGVKVTVNYNFIHDRGKVHCTYVYLQRRQMVT